jgi:hypothetical protein
VAPATASVVPPKDALNTGVDPVVDADTEKLPLGNVQSWLNGQKTPEVAKAAVTELIPVAQASGVSGKDLKYMVENGDVDKLLGYSARKGSSSVGEFINKIGLAVNALGTGFGSVAAAVGALPEYVAGPASYRQALGSVGFYPGLVTHIEDLNNRYDSYQTKEQLLARYGLTLPAPVEEPKVVPKSSANSIFASDFFTPEQLADMARRQGLAPPTR